MSRNLPLVAARAAAFRYAGQASVVGPFDFVTHAGEWHLISAPSGSGKSTLARMLCGLIPHLYRGEQHGHVEVAAHRTDAKPLWWLTTQVGFVGQNPAVQLLTSTVKDEIVFGLKTLGLSRGEVERRTETALTGFGLERLAARDPRTLSGGEQQKLVLASSVARQPQALVLDEPLSMLDTASAHQIIDQLDRLRREGCAIVALEHRAAPFAEVEGLSRVCLRTDESPDTEAPEFPVQVPAFRLALDDVHVQFGGAPVLEGITCTLRGGQVVGLVGPNGSGKTTLLRTVVGLQQYRGHITAYAAGTGRAPRLGLCFQNPDRQIFNPTVRQELCFGISDIDESLYDQTVKLLGLTPYEETPPLLLSEGEKKRLALGTVLLQPGLSGVCLDEPTLGQDAGHRRRLGRVLKQLTSAGYLCLVATHDLEWAAEWCDQLLVLRAGRLTAADAPGAILAREELWTEAGLLLPHSLAKRCRVAAHIL